MAELPEVSNSDEHRSQPELSGISLSLLRVLERRCNRLANWYSGAYQTLNDSTHPDKLPCAAHALREVMEKFPECAGLTVVDVVGNAANIVRATKRDFDVLVDGSEAAGRGWEGQFDGPTREFLVSLKQRIDEFDSIGNQRTEQMQQTIRVLLPGGATIPDSHHRPFLRAWNDLRQYFNGVAHHRTVAEEVVFRDRLAELERMIGTQLAPTPTDDMDVIDRMIEEAEHGN